MQTIKATAKKCATCGSWFGGSRMSDGRGNVKYESSPKNIALCKHPLSGRTNKETKPEFTCPKWMPAFQ